MNADLNRFLAASLAYALRERRPSRRTTDRRPAPQAGSEAGSRRLLDVVGGFTWPELVALELMRQEDAATDPDRATPMEAERDGVV